MPIKSILWLLLGGAAAAVPPLAPAETLRCGAVLIQPGDDSLRVLESCGPPNETADDAGRAWSTDPWATRPRVCISTAGATIGARGSSRRC